MANKLTKKERGFVKEYIKTENGTQSALKVYDTKSAKVASVIASENLAKPRIRSAIYDAISDEDLGEKHKQLLQQQRLDYFVFPKSMEDDEITNHVEEATGLRIVNIRYSDKGKMAFYATDDAGTQAKALELGYKLKGSFAPEKHVTLNLDATIPNEELQSIAMRLNELERNNP